MAQRKVTIEAVKDLREKGVPAAVVAEMFGISRTRVYQISRSKRLKSFKEITTEQNIYPLWRNWMNENSVSPRCLLEMMGLDNSSGPYNVLWGWMNGRCYPSKKNIDRLINATGLTYEQLFATEDPV